jgi:hypothetical protein
MAYKVFRQGEPPSQRDLQMLMDQSVIVATSTARPFAPHEGMLIYELDTNGFAWYNGTVWVALGGSPVDAWVSGSDFSVPGNLSANGTFTATGAASVASLASANDITIGGFNIGRLVDGKVVGSNSSTGSVSVRTVVPGANAQNVSVIQDRCYRASGMISISGSVVNSRAALTLWDGTVGTTKLGADVNCRYQTNFQSYPYAFIWRASATGTIANLNLAVQIIDGGNCTAQTDGNYFMVVEQLGSASVVGGL